MSKQLFLLLLPFLTLGLMLNPHTGAYTRVGASPTDCGCDHTVPLDRWKTDGVEHNIQPGDTVCLGSGTRGNMRLEDLTGTAEAPITIQNCGGRLTIDTTSYGISVARSQHIRLTGSGDPAIKYGLDVGGTIGVGELSTNVEVDHLEVHDAGFAGFLVKTDPNCDPATWRENFTMYDVSLHDNYVHHTGDGEGFYVGFTFSDGYEITCDGQTITVYGHYIDGLQIYDNLIEDTGAEGIQVSSAPLGNARVYDNTIIKYGQRPFANYQNNGMQIGTANVTIYNNHIQDGPGNGLIVFGTGHRAFNNVIVDTGGYGIFVDDRAVGPGQLYVNNTIVNTADDAVRLYTDESTTPTLFKNNLIVNPATGRFLVKLNDNVDVDESHNLYLETIAEAHFTNINTDEYALMSSSPAVDSGTDLTAEGITFDFNHTTRPIGTAIDIGAFEYQPLSSPLDQLIYVPYIQRP